MASMNNFETTKKFLITKFDCTSSDTYLFSVTYSGLAAGCPRHHNANQNSQDLISTTQTGAVRCCSFDGGSCESEIPECSTLTFSNAKQECSEFGMRLCTEEELAGNICCGTGCSFDLELVWYTKGNLFGSKLCNQVHSLDHFVVQNFGDFLC